MNNDNLVKQISQNCSLQEFKDALNSYYSTFAPIQPCESLIYTKEFQFLKDLGFQNVLDKGNLSLRKTINNQEINIHVSAHNYITCRIGFVRDYWNEPERPLFEKFENCVNNRVLRYIERNSESNIEKLKISQFKNNEYQENKQLLEDFQSFDF